MINLKKLTWSNAFSYGRDNTIDFANAPLTQLVGKNGHGKSSVALVLEEVLFNKNSKGIKKADILNRYVKDKHYDIALDFDKDGVEYRIETRRGSTQTVKFLCNNQDVSSHTATATYKHIEQVLGLDHKAFSQIVYQSSASSLEFLTAPDTARKKFLIEILNLGKYTRAQEVFKETQQELSKDISSVQAQVNTVSSWLDKYGKIDLTIKEFEPVPEVHAEDLVKYETLTSSVKDIEQINKKIAQNNTYKELLEKVVLLPLPAKPDQKDLAILKTEGDKLNTQKIEQEKTLKDSKQFSEKMAKLEGVCPTCLQPIDTHKITELVNEQSVIQASAAQTLAEIAGEIAKINAANAEYTAKKSAWERAVKAQEDWEKYHAAINSELPEKLLDKDTLEAELEQLTKSIQSTKKQIVAAEARNREIASNNSKAETISAQLVEMRGELEKHSDSLGELTERMSIINVLAKTFSTTGLVAYKIECLVKDLEEITNHYLVDLSDGRFQISFKISASDKLNVVITDNGKDIEMLALSGGERARVNVATLLAIRKLMQTLSSSRINLLILDETVEALDVDGKERLVEVLLNEEHLNTFLVSHGFTHPLLEKVNVIKQNNISKIEV